MTTPYAGIAANLDKHILTAALPLLEDGKVEAIEWSFDALFNHRNIPDWFVELLSAFAKEKRLVGHGVFFSIFKAEWSPEQQRWLDHLKKVNNYFKFDHVSEHFGFMTGENFHNGAPLSLPLNSTTLAIGRDRLQRISDAVHCPVGLENLAFAYSLDEVKRQGAFLDDLMKSVNGFVILDLHNIYCQAHNFDVDPIDLIKSYPLNRVREVHISGGSFVEAYSNSNKQIRRDTHNHNVPQKVFDLLPYTLANCHNIAYCMLEQLGNGLVEAGEKAQFRLDFEQMKTLISHNSIQSNQYNINNFHNSKSAIETQPWNSIELQVEQTYLSNLLETEPSIDSLIANLKSGRLANTDWKVEMWDIDMLATAHAIAQKWK